MSFGGTGVNNLKRKGYVHADMKRAAGNASKLVTNKNKNQNKEEEKKNNIVRMRTSIEHYQHILNGNKYACHEDNDKQFPSDCISRIFLAYSTSVIVLIILFNFKN